MKTIKLFGIFLTGLLLLSSCSSDDGPDYIPKGKYESGFFVVNEGPFQDGSGTITHISIDGVPTQEIFKQVNGEDLGNIVQSMTLVSDKAYIVVNNSDKIVVANRYTFNKMGEVAGALRKPRYMVTYGKKGYVSNWGDPTNPNDDFIAIVNLESDQVTGTIPVGEGPEDMIVVNSKLYVNLQGGWGINDKVVIIDLINDAVITELKVDMMPNSITADLRGNIWVMCNGRPGWMGGETSGSLVQISAFDDEVKSVQPFPEATMHPQNLTSDGNVLYYTLNQEVYMMSTVGVLPDEPLRNIHGSFYSMVARGGKLITTDAKDYASEGVIRIYEPGTGTVEFEASTGIVPTQVVFQY